MPEENREKKLEERLERAEGRLAELEKQTDDESVSPTERLRRYHDDAGGRGEGGEGADDGDE